MELSERYIQQFEREGFMTVYEHQDPAGTVYEEQTHAGPISIFVTDGSVRFTIAGEQKIIKANERFDVPVGVAHCAVVGPDGWIVIVGEK